MTNITTKFVNNIPFNINNTVFIQYICLKLLMILSLLAIYCYCYQFQDKIIEVNPQMIELEQETEELMNSIEVIAQENLEKQQMLDDIKTEVVDRISTIVQMKMNFEEMNRKHQKLSEMYDPYKIRDYLKEAAMKADEESEVIAEKFLTGKLHCQQLLIFIC